MDVLKPALYYYNYYCQFYERQTFWFVVWNKYGSGMASITNEDSKIYLVFKNNVFNYNSKFYIDSSKTIASSSSSSKPAHTNNNSQSTTTPPTGKHPAKISPLNRHRNSLEYVTFFDTILCDLVDLWPKITQEIRSFFVDWAKCLPGYRYEEVFWELVFGISRFWGWLPAAPAFLDVPLRCEVAFVSGEVASQRKHFPACHAVEVTPSGRLASVRCKPSGSLVDGMFALDNAL